MTQFHLEYTVTSETIEISENIIQQRTILYRAKNENKLIPIGKDTVKSNPKKLLL